MWPTMRRFVAFAATAPKKRTNRVMFSSKTRLLDLVYIIPKGITTAMSGQTGKRTDVPATENRSCWRLFAGTVYLHFITRFISLPPSARSSSTHSRTVPQFHNEGAAQSGKCHHPSSITSGSSLSYSAALASPPSSSSWWWRFVVQEQQCSITATPRLLSDVHNEVLTHWISFTLTSSWFVFF